MPHPQSFWDSPQDAPKIAPYNVFTESVLPASIFALSIGERAFITVDEDLVETRLRRLCAALGEVVHAHYEVRRMEGLHSYLITRHPVQHRKDRKQYPYSTLEIAESFRIPQDCEPNEQNLRVHTSVMGKKLGRKFSVSVFEPDSVFIIIRKE